MELLPGLERAFGIAFSRNLTHIRTAGDLFDEILALRPPSGEGDRNETGMAFYSLRRALAPFWDEPSATPSTTLGGKELPLPKRLKRLLQERTGYELPRPAISMVGLLAAVTCAGGSLWEFATGGVLLGVILLVGCIAAVSFDPGEFSGDWATLGSLALEVTHMNFATLTDGGARDAEADRWRIFTGMLARYAFVGGAEANPSEIVRETVLRFS